MYTLLFLYPGHFHAGLILREAHPLVREEIHVHGEPGPGLDDFLALLEAFNARAERPTHWKPSVHGGTRPLDKLIEMHRNHASDGSALVVLAGRNDSKMADIAHLHAAGFHVLGDKPWIIGAEGLPDLDAAVDGRGPLLMDIMTSRYEPTSILLKWLSETPDVFGMLEESGGDMDGKISGGEAETAAISRFSLEAESVHHLSKMVNGVPLVRPGWYFDVRIQGNGLVDVPTHLADLAQWLLGEPACDYERDVTLHHARLWSTPVPPRDFTRITGLPAYPEDLRPWVKEGVLHYPCNGALSYALRGHGVHLRSLWHLAAPRGDGGGDTHYMRLRGTLADIVADQGPATGFEPRLRVIPKVNLPDFAGTLRDAVWGWREKMPGVEVVADPALAGSEYELKIPPNLRSTHEEHFSMVLNECLRYLEAGSWPESLAANLRTKYTLLARASEMAESPGSVESA